MGTATSIEPEMLHHMNLGCGESEFSSSSVHHYCLPGIYSIRTNCAITIIDLARIWFEGLSRYGPRMTFISMLSILYKFDRLVLRPHSCVNLIARCVFFQTFCAQLEARSERFIPELGVTNQANQRIIRFDINHCLWDWFPNYLLALHHP